MHRFCDLGAGAGAFAEVVMDAHPESTGVLVDFSDPMLAAAEHRLASHAGRWTTVKADLATPAWLDALPDRGPFDAVVSGFCIHHLPDDRKHELYDEAFRLLAPGGLFLNWEHVEFGGLVEGMLEEQMMERLLERERGKPEPRSDDEVVRAYLETTDEDILATAEAQCDWLREIGFEQVDAYFKAPELAIFGGVKG